jgi:hypothetical protein
MRVPSLRINWALTVLLLTAVLVASLAAQQATTLVITGQSGSAKIIRVDGRNYVEIEGLARLMNSSMSFNGNQIVLTMSGSAGDASASAPPAETSGFSKDFITTGIEAMALVREWHAALGNAIQRGYPLDDAWLTPYRNKARQSLRLASVAVSTPADKSIFPFLTNEFNNMQNLSNKYLQLTVSRAYIDPNSLDSDPLDQKILSCGHSLASMATANQFVDDGSCQ